ncbi:hypothetical protein SAMN02910356_00139 [Selenomonas sp. GACV-9]|nr:hypothetical protein SAMN02910356_00139 [Selenomonas ruminantium]
MQEKQKLSMYIYNKATALEEYQFIKNKYVVLFLVWDMEVQRWLESDLSI